MTFISSKLCAESRVHCKVIFLFFVFVGICKPCKNLMYLCMWLQWWRARPETFGKKLKLQRGNFFHQYFVLKITYFLKCRTAYHNFLFPFFVWLYTVILLLRLTICLGTSHNVILNRNENSSFMHFLKTLILILIFRWTSDTDQSLKYGHPELHLLCAHRFWKG